MKSYTIGDTGSSSKFDVVGSNRHFKRTYLAQIWNNPLDDKAGGQLDVSCLKILLDLRLGFPELEIFSQRTQPAV